MKIRQTGGEEPLTSSRPLQMYAFSPSPMSPAELEKARARPLIETDVTLVAEEDTVAVATVVGTPMTQNVRGRVYPMAGIAGVATHPLARRQGHVRALLTELLGQMRDSGYAVSALYPFRPSFYQRFGYVGLPQARTVTLVTAELAPFLRAELPGELSWQRLGEGYPEYRAFLEQLLPRRHGFALYSPERGERWRREDDGWLVTARVDGTVVGAVTYRITDYGADLVAGDLLATGPLGRALLLGFFARHADQVTRVVATVAPDDLPELWATDLTTHTESRTSAPGDRAPMARVLSVPALAGLPVGAGVASVRIVDDPFIAGGYRLDGSSGLLEVAAGGDDAGAATLTSAGFAALVYGVLDPVEVVLRGLGTVPPESAGALRTLFPPRVPYVFAQF